MALAGARSLRSGVALSFALAGALCACTPGPSRSTGEDTLAAQEQRLRAFCAGAPRWAKDERSGEARAMVSVGLHRFAFRHDSIEPRTGLANVELLLKFPRLRPMLDGYCSKFRLLKVRRPDLVTLAIVDQTPSHQGHRVRTRAELWRQSEYKDPLRLSYPEMGLESRKFRDGGGSGHELLIPLDDRRRAPLGELVAIDCYEPLGIGRRESETFLGCGFEYWLRPKIRVTLRFNRALLPHWQPMLERSVELLEEAYRGPPSG